MFDSIQIQKSDLEHFFSDFSMVLDFEEDKI